MPHEQYIAVAFDDERTCRIEVPEGWYANWDKLRYTGHEDYCRLLGGSKPSPLGDGFSR